MPSETREIEKSEKKAMATDVIAPGTGEPRDDKPQRTTGPSGPGFFTIYKKGQGYWTRMGTIIGASLLGLLTAYNIYNLMPAVLPTQEATSHNSAWAKRVALYSAAVFIAAYAAFVFWFTNKPRNVDFLIATDSEMKKVNWTSRGELIGSTKIVILFMFLIALILFAVDELFWMLFYLIGVLKASPFGSTKAPS